MTWAVSPTAWVTSQATREVGERARSNGELEWGTGNLPSLTRRLTPPGMP